MMEITPEVLEDAAKLWRAMGFVNDRHGSIKHLAENLAIRDQAHAFAIAERDARIAELERQLKEETERGDRISSDWFEFCDDVGVRADTQEAVAYKIKADFSNLRHEKEAAESLLKGAAKLLEPFAVEAQWWEDYSDEESVVESFPGYEGELTVGHLRSARAIFDKIGGKGDQKTS